ncbi:choice-of-anchor L domain-containing protein [Dolichospermum flos-aquae]|uniref:Choice-of-anchor L domain-containing protein n=1 Tax=Dolichospermum flos-aquae LEGE 04289 TaxID=1828708 RepID=A0ACC5Q6G8_DOLFA|nr:choice-of-anchor L domain-containing protein [Dolichospermum flos-aquae]MBE9220734.1 choice-of-anchor L domain-containing protein [Dolichospermum flos-aquae LEGE 04289]
MNFSLLLESALKLTYDKLSGFSDVNNNFWQVFDSAFGRQYNRSAAEILRLDWQGGNFSQLPQIEVVSNTILGNANGAYSTSTNKIYLSDTFVANANSAAVSDVILEEIGHFVDARINQTDSAGDEGAIFAALVRGESLNVTTLQSLQAENDHATIIINGEAIAIEQSALITRDLNSVTAAQLVNTLIGNSGITPDKISNIRFTGANVAGGTFTGGQGTIGINGIILSTGNIDVDDDPSTYSTSNGKSGDRDLDAIVKTIVSNNSTYDAAVLEFDFIPSSNTISFSYVFASEDYPQLGNSRFNDVFAFYLNGKNIAFVPGATTPVSINTVNAETNRAFFQADYYGNILGTKFDGFTTVLSAVATDLIPGQINHIKLAIADTRDSARDAAVFIQGFSDPSTIVKVIATDSDAGEGTPANPGVFTITRTGSTNNALTVSYTISGTASTGDYSPIPSTVTFLAGETSKTVTITPVNDNLVEGAETVILSLISGTNYSLGTDNSATVIITDNDVDPGRADVSLSVNPASVLEDGTTNLVYTFTRAGDLTNALTVNFNVGGSATFSSDSNYTDYTQTGAASFGLTRGSITFAAGASTATLTINPKADTTFEGNENVELTLAPGSGYVINTATAVIGTIIDEDTNVNVAVSPDSVNEDGTANLVYTFSRYGKIDNALTVNYSIGGTADGADYTGATPGTGKTITFDAGQTTKTVTINPTADSTFENDETVIFTIASGTGYTPGTSGSATGTIDNDDFPSITLTVSPGSVNEDGTTNLIYTFTRTGVTTDPLTVNYSIGGTANGDDYTGATPGTGKTITFEEGENTATLIIDPKADTIVESNETVAVTLDSGTGYTLGTPGAVVGTINDDDTASITVTVTPSSVFEDGTGNLVYTFTRSYPGGTSQSLGNPLTVNYSIGGTANGDDYTGATPGTGKTITFEEGENTATLIIDPKADTIVESNETVAVTLDSGTGYTLGTTAPVVGTINDDDTASITVTVTPSSVFEDGTGNLVYTFTRSYPGGTSQSLGNPLTVNYSIGGTANGDDYTGATPGTGKTITFEEGENTATLIINPKADTIVESNETVVVTLANGSGYTLGTTAPVVGTINDDDTASITVTVTPSSVNEDGTTNLVYTFTRSYPGGTSQSLGNPLAVNYSIGGTANGDDYTGATPGTGKTITFAANSDTATLTINPTSDNNYEGNETVVVTLASGTGYTVHTPEPVTGTINDDNDRPTLSFSGFNNNIFVEDFNNSAVIVVDLIGANGQLVTSKDDITFNYTTSPTGAVSAIPGVDYNNSNSSGTVTILAGTSSGIIRIPILTDNINEPDESFLVKLSNATNATIDPSVTDDGIPIFITDTLPSAQTRTLPNLVENLTLIGTGNINGTGNAGNNVITGNSGDNTLTGRAGNDTYVFSVANALGADTIVEAANEGIDTIDFSDPKTNIAGPVNMNLGITTQQSVTVSNLKLTLSAGNVIENAIGGAGNDLITGNALNNLLQGGSGNDQLSGQNGNDILMGGPGADILTGGNGNDTLWGGSSGSNINTNFDILEGGNGNDTFWFKRDYSSSSSPSLGLSSIRDFVKGQDKIALSKASFNAISIDSGDLSATDFAQVTDDALATFSNARIVYSQSTGYVFYNSNGSAAGGESRFAKVDPGITLDRNDFTVIGTQSSSVDYVLSDLYENFNLTGTGNINGTGNTGNNFITGNSGNNILDGGSGNDTLIGGLGNDTLIGGLGNDQYQFNGVFNNLGVDTINFQAGQISQGENRDKIALSKATFSAITNAVGQALTDFGVVPNDNSVGASNARIVYSQGTGSLFYNSNGSNPGGESKFAVLSDPTITLVSSDFTLIA